ncbi:MAG TPA: HAD-IA family hydrolase [Candidatus Binatia bacterium]|nr:HAD-IA family hydrolase [Candidatus Binatia bacterium]
MKFQAIIFDLFGTIVDGFIASSAGLSDSDFPAALGVPNDSFMQNWRDLIEKRTIGEFQTVEASIEHACKIIGACPTAEQMAKAVEVRLQLTRRALTPKSDAIATLAKLRNTGFKIGLLSNCSIEIPIVWPETEFADLFDVTVFSSRERVKKPAPEIYHLACQRLGVRPEECVYVADGENFELTAAADVGMYPVLIRTSSQKTRGEVLREAREWQGATVSELSELIPLVVRKK